MKYFVLALFVAAVAASPLPEDDNNVEVVVNGLPEGQALDLSGIVDINLKEHVNGQVAASQDLLRPFSAVGIAEAAAAAAEQIIPSPVQFVDSPAELQPVESPLPVPEVIVPSPIPQPETPVVPLPVDVPVVESPEVPVAIPEPVFLPEPSLPIAQPEAVESVPAPEVSDIIPGPVPLPEVSVPEPEILVPQPEIPAPIPEPAAQLPIDLLNDGLVQVQVNGGDAGVLATLQSWFNLAVNYFSDGVETSHQIV